MNKLKDLKLKNQLIISTYIMLFILLIFKPTLIPSIYNRLIIAFKPFIIGGLIAFLINIPMKLIEEKIIKDVCVTIVHANVFLSCIIGSPKALPLFGRFALTAVQTGLRKRSLQSG